MIIAALFASCVKDRNKLVCPNDNPVAFTFGGTRAAAGHPVDNDPGMPDAGVIPADSSFGVFAWENPDGASAVTNFTDLQNMKVWHNTSGTGDPYTYTPLAFWPLDPAGTMSFMAYYPYRTNLAAGPLKVTRGSGATETMTFDYTVSGNSGNHIDLMYARTNMIAGYAPVPLTFNHALTRIRFEAKMAISLPDRL